MVDSVSVQARSDGRSRREKKKKRRRRGRLDVRWEEEEGNLSLRNTLPRTEHSILDVSNTSQQWRYRTELCIFKFVETRLELCEILKLISKCCLLKISRKQLYN